MNINSPSKAVQNIFVIGTSLGGINALSALLSQLPKDFPAPIFIVMHLHANSPKLLDKILAKKTELTVKFAANNEKPTAGTVYLAKPDCHLIIKKNNLVLSHGPRENRFRPSIDVMFRSAAVNFDGRVTGVILTGLLDDGVAGLAAVKICGGLSVVQDANDAEFSDMPVNASEAVDIDYNVAVSEMGKLFMKIVKRPADSKKHVIPPHLQQEVRLAEGEINDDIEKNIVGQPVPVICPDCGGGLNEIVEGQVTRFRCHEGHAYNSTALMKAQSEQTEYSLWAAIRSLEEQANVLLKLAKRNPAIAESVYGPKYKQRADELKSHAKRIKDFLLNDKSFSK